MDKKEISLLKAEIDYQIEAIEDVILKIHERKNDYAQDSRFAESLAYQLHNLYCAFEDLFKIIAKFFENSIEDQSRYHIELLKRMTLDIQGVRPPLISRELCSALDELRAFRHAYSYDIDAKKIGLLLEKFEYIAGKYKEDIQTFITLLSNSSPEQEI
ncbi:MAG: hypothetical protein GY797_28730 [Deltaproteobacteria bacterium]|nr:hypothetical protein [Deltaproteobacteria bacterium]